MSENMNQTENAQRLAVQCACGKQLTTSVQYAGKRLKCPHCSQPVLVPLEPQQHGLKVENEQEGFSKTIRIALWSFVGVFALGCVLFLVVWSYHLTIDLSLEQQRREQLARIEETQLVEQARIEEAQQKANTILDDAKRQIDSKQVIDAIALLRQYVADPNATEEPDAQRLLDEAETAISDELTLNLLIAMNDEQFNNVKAAGSINDGRIKHPSLVVVRNRTVQRNLDKASQQREENAKVRLAEEKRKEEKRLSISSMYLPIITEKENVVYVSQARPVGRANTGEGGYGNTLIVEFDGEKPKAGDFYDINGKPTRLTVSVDNENIISVDKDRLKFENPGKTTVTIKLGDYSKTIRFHIVEIPIPPNATRNDVVETLGFPDEKKEESVTWPKFKSLDGIGYSPKITQFGPGTIYYEHWRYKKYPGLVLAWGEGFKVLTRKPESRAVAKSARLFFQRDGEEICEPQGATHLSHAVFACTSP